MGLENLKAQLVLVLEGEVDIISYYNKRNAHFDVQESLLQFRTERRETWQEYGEA